MATRILRTITGALAIAAALVLPDSCSSTTAQASVQSAGADLRERAARIVVRIRRADYEGNRADLNALLHELTPAPGDASLASRVHYWRGFALWRRAFNGFNEPAPPPDLGSDLERAATEFEQSAALDPAFADATIGLVSCLQNLAFVHRNDPGKVNGLVKRFVPLTKALLATASDNPRFLWVHGASLWYALPGLSDAQLASRRAEALAAYQRGLGFARTRVSSDPLEPSWGEPELLMNLAWSHLNAAAPDFHTAESHARQALALVPDWHFVRDLLLPRILQTRAQRRLDVLEGRWTVRGTSYADAAGVTAPEAAGTATIRRTARGNWLLSEVLLDGTPPYGVTVLVAPQPDASYVAVAANNFVPAALSYTGRWVDDRNLEFDMTAAASGRRQRVRYTVVSESQLEIRVTESRDDGLTYHNHSLLALKREP